MGIYDRDYYQQSPREGISFGGAGSRMMVTNLVLVNVGVYLADLFLGGKLSQLFALSTDLPTHPWRIYELLTYGFLHDQNNLGHIVFNMFGLWFFGRDVELKYGRKELLGFYLSTIVLSGAGWLVAEKIAAPAQMTGLVGASGGIMGVLIVYALNFPFRTLLIWGVLPMPAWALAGLYVVFNILGATGQAGASNVAYTAHLAGAAAGLLFYRTGWHLGRLLPGKLPLKGLQPRPRLQVHDPGDEEEAMAEQVDAILRKIQEHGQDSLSRKERRILAEASRRYQQRQR